MKHIVTIGMVLVATCALSGIMASSSLAACDRVTENGKGNYMAGCVTKEIGGNFIKTKGALEVVAGLPAGAFCAETEEPNTGNYQAHCLTMEATAQFIRVKLGAPAWQVNGVKLEQGKRLANISPIQAEPELKVAALFLKIWISCKSAAVQNAYIEGNGSSQGQGSASSIVFEKCTTHEPVKCIVNEPIKTKQLKAHLVEYINNAKQLKLGELFEPSHGEAFTELSFKAGEMACPLGAEKFPVKGSVVANVFPENQEGPSNYLTFPQEPVTKVIHESTERTVGLTVGSAMSTLSGIFEAKLASGEKWGVFGL